MQEITVCKYCGHDSHGRVDKYGEDECQFCADFFAKHLEPPIPPPVPTLVNLSTGEIVIRPVKEKK